MSYYYETISVDANGRKGEVCDEGYLLKNLDDLVNLGSSHEDNKDFKVEGPFYKQSKQYKSVVSAMENFTSTVNMIICRSEIDERFITKLKQKMEEEKNDMFVFLGSIDHKGNCDVPTTVMICELRDKIIEIHLLCNQEKVDKGGQKIFEYGMRKIKTAYPSVSVYLVTGKNNLKMFYERNGFKVEEYKEKTNEYVMVLD